jgi:hypothetical protein
MTGAEKTVPADGVITLPAAEARERYQQLRDAGAAEEASRLHQAYFEVHRIRLSVDRQVAEAIAAPQTPNASPTRPAPSQQSTIRRVGVVLQAIGFVIAAFSAAAGVGGVSLLFAVALTSAGFILWLTGIVEDRLIEIRLAIVNEPR